jgi:hypothetical protein
MDSSEKNKENYYLANEINLSICTKRGIGKSSNVLPRTVLFFPKYSIELYRSGIKLNYLSIKVVLSRFVS